MGDSDPYPAFLGLDWAIDMGGIINLKKRSMVFENGGVRVIFPLLTPRKRKVHGDSAYRRGGRSRIQVNYIG